LDGLWQGYDGEWLHVSQQLIALAESTPSSAGDYTELHTRSLIHLLRESMNSLEQRLDPTRFARIHRSRIVNLARTRELRGIENREYVVKLRDGSEHRSSRTYADRIEGWLRGEKADK
jgi:two-component system, LytTR family, response regulator